MKLTHRLTITTALSATLATALIAGPATASPADENVPTGPPPLSSTPTSWLTTPSW